MNEHFVVFVIGPAGSGKSTFTSSFRDWLVPQNVPVTTLNMDPAVEELAYLPDIDIREYVFVRNIQEKYKLGPNGAIIASVDLSVEYLGEINKQVEESPEGYVLVDTPGQMEIFMYRQSGEIITSTLCSSGRKCAAVVVMDATIATSPSDFISQVFLAASSYYRLNLPMVALVNKIDLLSREERERLEEWISDIVSLEEHFLWTRTSRLSTFTSSVLRLLHDFMQIVPFIPISSKTGENFETVYFFLQQVYMGGEDFELPEKFREV
uniref:GTPase n=1 Tax=Thermofilum pendens TaxID=2269 RepID=A0A7C4FFQ1_THEPE